MTDKEFEQLKEDLTDAMNKVDKLQDLYRKETGRFFVRPLVLGITVSNHKNK